MRVTQIAARNKLKAIEGDEIWGTIMNIKSLGHGKNEARVLNKEGLFVGILVMRIALDYAYAKALCPYYSQYGMHTYNPDLLWFVISFGLLALTAAICSAVLEGRPSSLFIGSLFVVTYVPITSLYYVQHLPHFFVMYSTVFWLSAFAAYYFTRNRRPAVLRSDKDDRGAVANGGRGNNAQLVLSCIPFAIVFISFLYSIIYNGGFDLALDLSEYGEMRQENKVASFGPVWQRMIFWSGCVFAPFGVAYSILHRKYALGAVFILFDLSITATNGTKSFLFTLVLTIVAAVILRNRSDVRWFAWIPYLIAAIVFFGASFFESELGSFVTNFITRRIFFTTSYNCWGFIDYFQNHEKMYELHRLLEWLTVFGVENPLGTDNVSEYMGTVIYGTTNNNNPAGTVGDAFMNFGLIGIIVYPLINVLCFRLIDRVSSHEPVVYIVAVLFSTTEYLANGSFLPVLFNYGYFAFVGYLWLIKNAGGLSVVFDRRLHHGSSFHASS